MIDIETTGLNPQWAEIVEIGAVRIKNNKIIARFQALIWPGEEAFTLSGVKDALRIQGRDIDDYREGMIPYDAGRILNEFIDDNEPATAFNVEFERKFLCPERNQNNLWVTNWPFCIMKKASEIMGEAGSHYCPWNDYHQNYKWPKLLEAADFFNVEYGLPDFYHSALHDAEIAANILLGMIEMGALEDG